MAAKDPTRGSDQSDVAHMLAALCDSPRISTVCPVCHLIPGKSTSRHATNCPVPRNLWIPLEGTPDTPEGLSDER